MANKLTNEEQDSIRSLFLSCGNIKSVATTLGFSRNTVKKIIRSEGLVFIDQGQMLKSLQVKAKSDLGPIHFPILERLFALEKEVGENLDFKNHIMETANSMHREIGIRGTTDKTKFESAIIQYILYLRFYMKSLTCSDKNYIGPFARSHEKLAKAVLSFVEASNKALEQFNRMIRELEVKYGRRVPDYGRSNIIHNHNQVAVQVSK